MRWLTIDVLGFLRYGSYDLPEYRYPVCRHLVLYGTSTRRSVQSMATRLRAASFHKVVIQKQKQIDFDKCCMNTSTGMLEYCSSSPTAHSQRYAGSCSYSCPVRLPSNGNCTIFCTPVTIILSLNPMRPPVHGQQLETPAT